MDDRTFSRNPRKRGKAATTTFSRSVGVNVFQHVGTCRCTFSSRFIGAKAPSGMSVQMYLQQVNQYRYTSVQLALFNVLP